MSGITGIFYRNGHSVDPELIKKMNRQLSHRGPDGSATWCDGPVGLGHQMLWTTPESVHEKLPFEDEASGLIITADARIDNRKELSQELGLEDQEHVSDSYYILKSYEKWGEECPGKLLGDFAFAIWDKNEEKLFCARDHMGIKQFYYYMDNNGFYFASEMKALLMLPGIPRKLDEFKLALFLTINVSDKYHSFYDNIVKLLPAHKLSITQKDHILKKYWELDPEYQIKMDSEEDYLNSFREIFGEAIQCRLRSALPVGFELSGGLDSSSVVCMARKMLSKENKLDLNTYSYVFNEFTEVDERYYINKVLDLGNIKHQVIYGDNITPLDNIDNILWFEEQPFFTPNLSIIWKLREKMNEDNIRILLTGDGGDEVISVGTAVLQEMALKFQWMKLFREIKALSKNRNQKFSQLILYYYISPFIPKRIKKWLSTSKKKDMFSENGTSILNGDFAKKLGGEDYLQELKWGMFKDNDSRESHYLALIHDPYVLDMNDRAAAAFSIEPRYPYLDKRLVEFCYGTPSEIKYRMGWNRFLQRFGLADILPSEIRFRTNKANFNPIYEKNLLENEDLVKEILSQSRLIEEYMDLTKIRKIYDDHISGEDVGHDKFAVWMAILLIKWMENQDLKKSN